MVPKKFLESLIEVGIYHVKYFIAFACNAKNFAIATIFFSSKAFLDGLIKVIFKFFFNCSFKHVSPGSELLIWFAVCYRVMSFSDKQ